MREAEGEGGGDAGEDDDLGEISVGGAADVVFPAADGGVLRLGDQELAKIALAEAHPAAPMAQQLSECRVRQ